MEIKNILKELQAPERSIQKECKWSHGTPYDMRFKTAKAYIYSMKWISGLAYRHNDIWYTLLDYAWDYRSRIRNKYER